MKLVLKASFKVGAEGRSKRNVYADGLKNAGVDNPYAVATVMVKKGAKPKEDDTKKDLKKERKRQKKLKNQED